MNGKNIWRVKWQCYIATIGVVPAVNYLEGIKRVSPLKCNVCKGGEYVVGEEAQDNINRANESESSIQSS